MGGEGGEVGRAAVVLVDEPARAVADDERRVAAGAVGDRRLDVDRHRQSLPAPPRRCSSPSVVRIRFVEAEGAQPLVELAARVAGDEDGDVAAHVALVGEPGLVEVVAVQVGDVEVVGVSDPLVQARRRAGRCAGTRTTTRRTPARTTGRRRSSRAAVSMRMPAWPSDVARINGERGRRADDGPAALRSGDGRVGVLLACPRDVLGPRRAVPVAQLEATGRVGVPARRAPTGVGRRRPPVAPTRSTTSDSDEPPSRSCRPRRRLRSTMSSLAPQPVPPVSLDDGSTSATVMSAVGRRPHGSLLTDVGVSSSAAAESLVDSANCDRVARAVGDLRRRPSAPVPSPSAAGRRRRRSRRGRWRRRPIRRRTSR